MRISASDGLLPGGAQRTTELIQRPRKRIPSWRESAVGCEANPVWCKTGYRKFPEPSPVNGRPVRFDPCAPGAKPRASTRAFGSPNEGTGFPQYSHSAYARRRVRAISAQYVRNREQRSHALTRELKPSSGIFFKPGSGRGESATATSRPESAGAAEDIEDCVRATYKLYDSPQAVHGLRQPESA